LTSDPILRQTTAHRLRRIGVVVPDIPLLQVMHHNAQSKRQVTQALGYPELKIVRYFFPGAVVGSQFRTHVAEYQSG